MKHFVCSVSIGALFISTAAFSEESFQKAITDSNVYLKERYRYETADQSNRVNDARASTLRSVLGVQTGKYYGFSALAEYENISRLGNDDYNDTLNGKNATHATIADPEDRGMNQLYLQFDGIDDTRLRAGRQTVTLDDHRFIGSVAWRQNDQTFDGFSAQNTSIENTTLHYSYLYNVNRIVGSSSPAGDQNGDIHLVNVNHKAAPWANLVAYYYSLDFDNAAFAANSSDTFGGSIAGTLAINSDWSFLYELEYAHQSDIGDNPNNYDAGYFHIAPAVRFNTGAGPLTATAGYEVLGSDDGNFAFRTPLSTAHKFNGWADLFLVTPAQGLEDVYLDLTYKVKGVSGDCDFLNGLLLKAQYHDFESEDGGIDFGTEFDFYAKLPIAEQYFVEAKYANFDGDVQGGLPDTERLILGVGASFNLF